MHPKARLPWLIFKLKKWFYPKAAGIIAQTELAKRVMQSYLRGGNIHVIPNPVNVIDRLDMPRKKIIVSVGRLEEVKGHSYLIEAFASLDRKDWTLSLIGDGSLRQELVDLSIGLGIQDRVLFHGYKKDFRKELSEASIFALPSLKEGFPNALLEAMAVPLPCIATDFMGQPNEIIKDGKNGLLVPVKDVKKLAAALKRLAESESLRQQLAREAVSVRKQFSFDKIANQYLSIISGEC
jgi:glycosyltransferase involved in cell wall biosynthesis